MNPARISRTLWLVVALAALAGGLAVYVFVMGAQLAQMREDAAAAADVAAEQVRVVTQELDEATAERAALLRGARQAERRIKALRQANRRGLRRIVRHLLRVERAIADALGVEVPRAVFSGGGGGGGPGPRPSPSPSPRPSPTPSPRPSPTRTPDPSPEPTCIGGVCLPTLPVSSSSQAAEGVLAGVGLLLVLAVVLVTIGTRRNP